MASGVWEIDLMSLAIFGFALDCEILAEDGHGPSKLRVNVPCPHEEIWESWHLNSSRSDRRRAHGAILFPFLAGQRSGPTRLSANCLCLFSRESRAAVFGSDMRPARKYKVHTCGGVRLGGDRLPRRRAASSRAERECRRCGATVRR